MIANAKLGTLLQAMPKRSGADSHGGGSSGSKRELLPDAPPTLEEIGIDRKTASNAQLLAANVDIMGCTSPPCDRGLLAFTKGITLW